MRGAMVTAPRQIEFRDLPVPTPGPGEALIRIRAGSICGTDMHTWRGENPRSPIPTMLGHEFAGEVVEFGGAVRGLAVGMRAAVDGVIPCHECRWCRRGLGNVCEQYRVTGMRSDGAMAEYTKVPVGNVHPLPDHVSFELAALAQPLAIAYHGVYERSQIGPGDLVVVEGAGPIGLFALALCKTRGARVISTDLVPSRLEMARRLGADEAIDVSCADPVERTLAMSDGLGADVVIEAVGGTQSGTVRTACLLARRGGSITWLGMHPHNHVDFPALDFRLKELTLATSLSYYGAYSKALDLLTTGALVGVEQMISHVMPMESLQEALELIEQRDPNVVKIILNPYGKRSALRLTV